MKFYAKVTSNDLTKALNGISAWDGKTRLGIENALQDGTKNIARGARQKLSSEKVPKYRPEKAGLLSSQALKQKNLR